MVPYRTKLECSLHYEQQQQQQQRRDEINDNKERLKLRSKLGRDRVRQREKEREKPREKRSTKCIIDLNTSTAGVQRLDCRKWATQGGGARGQRVKVN